MTDLLLYIPDLPSGISDDNIQETIQNRIESTQRMTLSDVKCYLNLGVAVIQMMNEDDKSQLVNNVQSIVLDPKQGITISFVSELELDTYIVFDRNISKIPSADEVARRYAQAYKASKVCPCESLSVQFPNIFRLFVNTLDQLVEAANSPDFAIDKVFATVYPRADCSFFEDLPQYTSDERITAAIATQIDETKLPPTSFYVQCSKQTGNAVVLASKSAKKWIISGHLMIDGEKVSKKGRLAYRLLVFPVPRGFDLDRILNHKLFAGRVVSHKQVDENLIVELDSLDHYTDCLEIGALRIDQNTMNIKSHTTVSDPDSSELNAMNWYETAMLDIKPDIVTMMHNHQHPIFRYKWNAQNWIEQMKKAEKEDGGSKGYDLDRHLLRVTVMLNTIAVLRKNKYAVDGEEVTLKPERMRTIGYDHKAKLSFGRKLLQAEIRTPYSSTTVKVINEDCLVLYEHLVSKGYRPVVLNMANAVNPGGGYRKGDGAQEENLFRRSDYYHSLDGEIADPNRSERMHYTAKCELKPLKGYGGFYPMEEFGAIYTSGITVFRQTEANGYAYMKNPLYNVCAIAMAAYRDPPLTKKNTLENRPAINTHRKIENIFAIAHQHKHDCLVLSALGCGAFRNPPKHVASLFKSVIYQYAGYFKEVYFAIIDDHNTGNRINPDGNFLPFQQLLDGLVVQPPKTLRANGVTGPYRVLEKTADGQLTLGDACISHLPPCQHGTLCRDLRSADHNRQFSHPPMCSFQDTTSSCGQTDDEVHMFTFMHTTKCKHGGECTSKDPTHLNDYDHPDFCKDQSHCHDISPDHLFAFRHLPVCRDGLDCPKYLNHDPDHVKSYRHCKSICPHDNCCIYFHDKVHMKNTIHSFREPCPLTPYNCSMYIEFIQNGDAKRPTQEAEQHCLQYAHVCPYGRQCKTKNLQHYETSIHIARQFCPDGDKCTKMNQEDHLESFSHPNIRDIRLLCREPGYNCPKKLVSQHPRKYRHGQNHNHLNAAPSSNLNSHVDFVQNQRRLIRTLNTYIDTSKWEKTKMSPEILAWIRALQPVHRCNKLIFESILVHGHVMSRHYMKLLERPRNVAKAVLQHSRVRLIFLKHSNPAIKENAFKLIKALVEVEFAKTGTDGMIKLDPEHEDQINVTKMRLKAFLNDHDLRVIQDWTIKISQASIQLLAAPMGIGYNVDEKMGTDKHVFSILGPHLGHYYGDIVITFKQEIMFHPDANFSIQAGTKFHSAKTYADRLWIEDQGTEKTRIEDFHSSKLHCSVPRYEHVAALELAALTGKDNKSMNVSLDDVKDGWRKVDSHDVFESHLPQLIPLDYVDCVYIPKKLFESLSDEAQQSAKGAFKDSLVITPLDPTSKPYLEYILGQIDEKIQRRMKTPHISRGVVITVPGSKFEEHIVLPMTISQSYDLYRLDQARAPANPEHTYIYWQGMNGDMMLTIANQRIESGKDQSNLRCLVCYVAGKPSAANEEYHEAYSYLNDGHPFRHDVYVHEGKFRAKSNVFYRGCNTDDFLTFSLKLSHRTGDVTLSHAGPNGIYNHQTISYQFNKGDLDLSRIDYVHVSGGNQDVPIRNLTINHESVPQLHPSADKDFKIDTSELLGRRRASVDHRNHGPYHESKPKYDHGTALGPRRPRSSSVQPRAPPAKPNIFKRAFHKLLGLKDGSSAPSPSSSDEATSNSSKAEAPPHHPSKAQSPKSNRPRPKSPAMMTSKLPPCSDSIYCLNQSSKDHTDQYSHPCRFNELCRNQAGEPHLVHQRLNVPRCSDDRDCRERTDPIHRAKYRHTNLPDYLFPCRNQESCYNNSSDHRIKFSHGEELPPVKKNKTLAPAHGRDACRYGSNCRLMKDPQHTARFSHPSS